MKRIVVLIDGTWNKEGTAGNTNVATLDIAHRIAANAFIKVDAADGTAQQPSTNPNPPLNQAPLCGFSGRVSFSLHSPDLDQIAGHGRGS